MTFGILDVVKVARTLTERKIRVFVTSTEIGSEIALEDYLTEMVEVIGGGLYTKAKLLERMKLASRDVQLRLQKEIAKEM